MSDDVCIAMRNPSHLRVGHHSHDEGHSFDPFGTDDPEGMAAYL